MHSLLGYFSLMDGNEVYFEPNKTFAEPVKDACCLRQESAVPGVITDDARVTSLYSQCLATVSRVERYRTGACCLTQRQFYWRIGILC